MAALCLLAGLVLAEEWEPLWREWSAALKRYEQACKQAPNAETRARIRHPIRRFRDRLRAFAIENAGYPAAAPALMEILRHTRDPEEQVWLMIQLRESHLRSKHLWRIVDALVRIEGEESLRTLEEIAKGSPHAKVAHAARIGVHERTRLAVGKPALPLRGKSKDGKLHDLKTLKGKPVVLVFGKWARRAELRALGVTVLGIGNDWPGWQADEHILRRWNAEDKPRLFVIDAKGIIRGKDLAGKALKKLIASLK